MELLEKMNFVQQLFACIFLLAIICILSVGLFILTTKFINLVHRLAVQDSVRLTDQEALVVEEAHEVNELGHEII